jgi:putative membrane protein
MSPGVKSFLQRWAITTVAVLAAAQVVGGIRYDSATALVMASLLLGILNAFVRPVLMLLTLPILFFTLGLFTLVINAVLLYLVGHIKGFHVDTFGAAFWGALIISLVSMVVNALIGGGGGKGNMRIQVRTSTRREPPRNRDGSGPGSGPVIDV